MLWIKNLFFQRIPTETAGRVSPDGFDDPGFGVSGPGNLSFFGGGGGSWTTTTRSTHQNMFFFWGGNMTTNKNAFGTRFLQGFLLAVVLSTFFLGWRWVSWTFVVFFGSITSSNGEMLCFFVLVLEFWMHREIQPFELPFLVISHNNIIPYRYPDILINHGYIGFPTRLQKMRRRKSPPPSVPRSCVLKTTCPVVYWQIQVDETTDVAVKPRMWRWNDRCGGEYCDFSGMGSRTNGHIYGSYLTYLIDLAASCLFPIFKAMAWEFVGGIWMSILEQIELVLDLVCLTWNIYFNSVLFQLQNLWYIYLYRYIFYKYIYIYIHTFAYLCTYTYAHTRKLWIIYLFFFISTISLSWYKTYFYACFKTPYVEVTSWCMPGSA